ncbi:MAG: beta/gamma crystallin family protein, partial [Burkholderiales bacterium]|nr:beta/gamma crystallin family protein [Burkholderiales bacterium]
QGGRSVARDGPSRLDSTAPTLAALAAPQGGRSVARDGPSRLTWLAAIAVFAVGAASAQEITLFQGENFNGPRHTAGSSVSDLARVGFNDRASSATIRGGSWQLCTDSYFRGQCVTLNPGDYPSLSTIGLNNQVSSVREVGWNSGGSGGGWSGGGGGGGGAGPGRTSIVLFENSGTTGRSYTLNGPTPNLGGTGFNDRATSAIVNGATWQLCVDADYTSTCEVFGPGRHDSLAAVTGRVSSARPFYGGGGNQGGGGWGGGNQGSGGWGGGNQGGGGWGGQTRVVIYEGPNFSGRSYTVNTDALGNLDGTGFNDRASSLRVERGYWMFCTDANLQGDCRTFGPGDYPSLSWFSNRISSGRRISNDYPYNAPPQWRN